MCQGDLHWVETVVDRGPLKRRAADYPVLARVARGEADGVLVVRSPLYERGRGEDRLERLCPEGPSGWLSADALAEAGLLPRIHKVAARRPSARQRAASLRASGLSLQQIAQALASEGYRRRGGSSWSVESVAELFGVSVLAGGQARWGADTDPPTSGARR